MRPLSALFLAAWLGSAFATEPMTEEELEAWFYDDSEDQTLSVSEGELKFLSEPPAKAVHHLYNRLTIIGASLKDGFVGLYQCHDNLDAVAEAQVVYRYRHMRNLKIDSHSAIGRAWVEDKSVQMTNIQKGAKLCISADVAILYEKPDGRYTLRNGPFHRRFLDGYYPMHVTLDIHFPQNLLRFESINPQQQAGFHLGQTGDSIEVNAWFEGMLTVEIHFAPKTQ